MLKIKNELDYFSVKYLKVTELRHDGKKEINLFSLLFFCVLLFYEFSLTFQWNFIGSLVKMMSHEDYKDDDDVST